ncbi:MAG: homogentisate 1,2-dioxygenase, partial [Gaiellaceae bacterium]
MPFYRSVGDIPRKRHLVHRVDGAVVAEELMGEHGFSADSSLLYHRHSPSAVVGIEPVEAPEPVF